MSQYTLYLFELENSEHCAQLNDYLKTLPLEVQTSLVHTSVNDATGARTELAEDLCVELAPTLVVTELCKDDPDDPDEEPYTQSLERCVGRKNIIQFLPEFLSVYTTTSIGAN